MRETELQHTWCDVLLDGRIIGMFSSVQDWNDFVGDELGGINSWSELVEVGYDVCFYKAPVVNINEYDN